MDRWESVARSAWEKILACLKKMRSDGKTLQEIASTVGVTSRAQISEWLDGTRKAEGTSFSKLMSYMERLGIDWQEVFFAQGVEIRGQKATIQRLGNHSPIEAINKNDKYLASVPLMGETGAGDAVELFHSSAETVLRIPPQYAKKDCIALVVNGDSMEPTIKRGSMIGVVPVDGDLVEGGIYLINRPPFGRTVKRVRISSSGQIEVYSDNKAYDSYEIPIEGYEHIILGKVVWVLQETF